MQIVAGLDEGLLSMKPGGLRRMYIPGQLAYPKGLPSGPGRYVAERCQLCICLCICAVKGAACLHAGAVEKYSPKDCTNATFSCPVCFNRSCADCFA